MPMKPYGTEDSLKKPKEKRAYKNIDNPWLDLTQEERQALKRQPKKAARQSAKRKLKDFK